MMKYQVSGFEIVILHFPPQMFPFISHIVSWSQVLTDATGAAVICKLSETEQAEDAENHLELN